MSVGFGIGWTRRRRRASGNAGMRSGWSLGAGRRLGWSRRWSAALLCGPRPRPVQNVYRAQQSQTGPRGHVPAGTGDDTGEGPDRGSTTGTPRWVKVFGIVAAIRIGLPNARLEGLDQHVRLIVRPAFGFHSARAALALVMLSRDPSPSPCPGRAEH